MIKITKLKKIILILIIILLLISLLHLTKIFLYKVVAENAINIYLENKNINEEEIEYLNICYDTKQGNSYNIGIKYKKEPNLVYIYTYKIKTKTLNYFSIYCNGTSILIEENKDIFPLYEDIEIIFNNDYNKTILLKYTLNDYINQVKTTRSTGGLL